MDISIFEPVTAECTDCGAEFSTLINTSDGCYDEHQCGDCINKLLEEPTSRWFSF